MDLRESYLAMIKAMPGGWGAMCGALAMTRDAVENRIYERKGQSVLVETALAMQSFSSTTLFAESVAVASGGTFVKLPDDLSGGNDILMQKFQQLYAELGRFSQDFAAATEDDIIDKTERRMLEADGARLHKVMAELMALSFRIYCPNGGVEVEVNP
ncbi:hypothetical protein INH39_02945 [Massilia violaceinigra]|uniref:Uncharacterized protein n=2 Tax=Massilia violaceinigra TaxID=2045208 RepID=A0ABY4AAM8_9BURK|nr:hypothetical protein INH39_02945 [Massilia violaceinigra]